MPKLIDISGQKFGHLTVIQRGENSKSGHVRWICMCDCGNTKTILASAMDLKSGKTTSCGCVHKSIITKHGHSKERLYQIWHGMIKRCENKHNAIFQRYGAKGIDVCEEWHDYMIFRDWALCNGYNDELTIDRKDNNKGYNPENCRWATNKQQSNNRTNNIHIIIDGETHTISEWSDISGVCKSTIAQRAKRGVTGKDVISKVRMKPQKIIDTEESNNGTE